MITDKKITCCKILFCIGLITVVVAICTYLNVNYIIKKQIYQNLLLENNSKAFNFFKNPPAKIIRKYYIFNVKNAKDVESGKAKPKLVQKGPYTYSEKLEKKNIIFEGKEALSYNPVVSLYFEPSLSVGNESDLVTFLNIPAVSMIHSVMKDNDNDNNLSYLGVNALMKMLDIKLFVTKTIGQLINGYDDPLMSLAKNFVPNVKESKFSLMNGRNGTEWERFSIDTGYLDITKVGQLLSWNNKTELNFWGTEFANRINGSDGTIYPPYMERDQLLYSFSPDMCRSYHLEYFKDNVIDGAATYDFHLPKNIFYNSSTNPGFEGGFCSKSCLGNGVLDISKCYGGAPSYISQPHFLNADQKFLTDVIGLQPNLDLHDFILHFEPSTGVALSGNIRLQISFHLKNYKKVNLVKNAKTALIPLVWFDEDIKVDSNITKQLSKVAKIIHYGIVIPSSLICFGLFWILVSLAFGLYEKYKLNKYLYDNNERAIETDQTKQYFKVSGNAETKEPKEAMLNS